MAGGGIAGPAVALALHKAGFQATVFEGHADTGEDAGAFLTLARNGITALAQFDADDLVAGAGFPLTSMQVLTSDGETAATAPLPGYRCLRRAELCGLLQAETVRRGIPLHHGKRVEAVVESDVDVTVRFGDGSTASGELLIGADGLNSAVRSFVAPAAAPRYAGQRVFYGYTEAGTPPHEQERIVMVRGSAVAFGYAVSPGGETSWFGRVHAEENSAVDRHRLLDLLRPDATPAADIVAATSGPVLATDARDVPSVARWSTRRTLLVGDAAHAASPATGQGASMALEDAVVLAKALRDSASPFETYERARRPRVEHNIANSARMTAGATSTVPRRREPVSEDELAAQLDWDTPLAGEVRRGPCGGTSSAGTTARC
ncbi:monooxygenase [Amycolatopsis sp. K13G38]|uniref:Monooxygenase n=1 Tax=Amycolatopsis acididurans TaxID=2724524 RepID=A0ABX1IXE4_9PSEU|nr:monooxygenase [Amycolatopsis acididurans]